MKAYSIYQEIDGHVSSTPEEGSKYVSEMWGAYKNHPKRTPSITGTIFELSIAATLAAKRILPFYTQASFSLIPNAIFDIVCYRSHAPVVMSLKTSLRERWKQADLEGMALKNVYRHAESYLLMNSEKGGEAEAHKMKGRIESGTAFGTDQCILADRGEYDEFLDKLAKYQFCEVAPIKPMQGHLRKI